MDNYEDTYKKRQIENVRSAIAVIFSQFPSAEKQCRNDGAVYQDWWKIGECYLKITSSRRYSEETFKIRLSFPHEVKSLYGKHRFYPPKKDGTYNTDTIKDLIVEANLKRADTVASINRTRERMAEKLKADEMAMEDLKARLGSDWVSDVSWNEVKSISAKLSFQLQFLVDGRVMIDGKVITEGIPHAIEYLNFTAMIHDPKGR